MRSRIDDGFYRLSCRIGATNGLFGLVRNICFGAEGGLFPFLKQRLANSKIFVDHAVEARKNLFEYAVVRYVPDIERGEFYKCRISDDV